MKTSLFSFALIVLLFLGQPMAGFCGAHHKGPELSDLPERAQKTIKAQIRGAKLLCIDPSVDNGQINYFVEIQKSGHETSFEVDQEGTLTRIQVALAETPQIVQKTIKSEIANGSIVYIDKFPDEDMPTYSVEFTKDGQDRSLTVDEDGDILDREVFLDELPTSLHKAIKSNVRGGRLGEIHEVYEDEEMSYSVNVTRHRKPMPFSLDDDGNLINAVVLLEETPSVVQKAIRTKITDAYLEQITLYVKDGKKTYDVTCTQADIVESFEVTNEGKIITTETPTDGVPRIGV
jgi:uncharacterized membrane protein YkoI